MAAPLCAPLGSLAAWFERASFSARLCPCSNHSLPSKWVRDGERRQIKRERPLYCSRHLCRRPAGLQRIKFLPSPLPLCLSLLQLLAFLGPLRNQPAVVGSPAALTVLCVCASREREREREGRSAQQSGSTEEGQTDRDRAIAHWVALDNGLRWTVRAQQNESDREKGGPPHRGWRCPARR